MGMLDDLINSAGGLGSVASMVASNPQLLQAAMSLLSTKDTSVGGASGLPGLIQAFQAKGLDDVMASWIGGGPNKEISASQVADVLGPDTLSQFAAKAGIGAGDAGSVLAGLLPNLVNQITPSGTAPQGDALESMLGSLLSGLSGRA
jgi:uncharacterized protein YidB (DUF937 family)